jgi:methyl-accepting chemotaxis protein
MIESFQKQANAAATTMQDNLRKIDTLVENSNVTDQSVQAILDSLQRINSMSADIDQQTSAQRQTVAAVAEDVEQIARIADGILGNASRNAEAFKELNQLVEKQSRSVSTFRLG